jgi:hypothetical protein
MVATQVTEKAPVLAPGIGTTEALQAALYRVKSAATITKASVSPVELFKVPPYTMIHDLILNVGTGFDGTGTPSITLGDSDDTDRFMDNSAAAPATAGFKSMKQDTQPGSGGYIYTADGLITATFSAGGSSAGSAEVWLVYSNRTNKD